MIPKNIVRRHMPHGHLHALIRFDDIREAFEGRYKAGGAVGVIDLLADGLELFGIGEEARCWWLVEEERVDEFWVAGEEFQGYDCTGAVAYDCGGGVGGEVFEEMGGVVGVCFESVGVVLCAVEVALGKSATFDEERPSVCC